MYRVWTKNFDGNYTTMNDWTTRNNCRKMIIGRWGHKPPFAFISKCKNKEDFIRHNGE